MVSNKTAVEVDLHIAFRKVSKVKDLVETVEILVFVKMSQCCDCIGWRNRWLRVWLINDDADAT